MLFTFEITLSKSKQTLEAKEQNFIFAGNNFVKILFKCFRMKLSAKDVVLDHLNSQIIYGYEDQQKLLFGKTYFMFFMKLITIFR